MELYPNLPTIIEKEIEALVRVGYYSSKTEAIKDAFRTLLDTRPGIKLTSSIELYRSGETSLSKSAEIAGLNIEDFKQVLSDRGIEREIKPASDIDGKVKQIMEWCE